MSRRSSTPFALLGLLLALSGCSDDAMPSNTADGGGKELPSKDGSVPVPGKDAGLIDAKRGDVSGRVFRADTLAPLSGVTIHGPDGESAKTGKDGKFTLSMVAAERTTLLADIKGFAQAVEPVEVIADKTVAIEFRMLRVSVSAEFVASKGATVRAESGAEVVIDKAAFVGPDGKPVTGMVTVELTVLDPSSPEGQQAFPGDFAATTTGGQDGQLESFVPMEITVRQGDSVLDFADGKGAEVSFPVPASLADKAPQTIALWSLSETTGAWVEEGTASLVTDGAGKLVYRGRIGHMSWWNCDRFLTVTCIRGCVTRDGVAAPFVQTEAEGIDFASVGRSSTDSQGCFVEDVKLGGQLRVRAFTHDSSSEWKVITAPTKAMTSKEGASKCFDVGTVELVAVDDNDCPLGSTQCGDQCVDLGSDAENCGACDKSCSATSGEQCIAGKCGCTASETKCGSGSNSVCTETAFDENNCGACGERCEVGETCDAGACKALSCAKGFTNCSGACVDLDDNSLHCGACGEACEQGETCDGTSCKVLSCSSTTELCDNECVPKGTCEPTTAGCTDTQFACGQTECIPLAQRCDDTKDCSNGLDEQGCSGAIGCSGGEYACPSVPNPGGSGDDAGEDDVECIAAAQVCDEVEDCAGGSDEQNCNTTINCNTDQIACENGQSCVLKTKLCDKVSDCADMSDEDQKYCDDPTPTCPNIGEVPCQTGGGCFLLATERCDEVQDCSDGSDELGCSINQCQADEVACKNGDCIIKEAWCDEVDDCLDGSDEESCSGVGGCGIDQFNCPGSQVCLPMTQWCDESPDCIGGEDEMNCGGGEPICPSGEKPCPGNVCVPEQDTCPTVSCPPTWIQCPGDGGCAPTLEDCKGGPISCDEGQTACTDGQANDICATFCNNVSECTGGVDEDPFQCCELLGGLMCQGQSGLICVPANQVCAGDGAQCQDGHDEDASFCCANDGGTYCSDGVDPICVPASQTCADDGEQCDDGRDEDVFTCCDKEEGVVCLSSGLQTCVPTAQVCADDGEQCDDGRDEDPRMCCVGPDTRLCPISNECIARNQQCDGFSDCADGTDEGLDTCGCPNVEESPCSDNEQCIDDTAFCNTTVDCTDGSDEGPQRCGCPNGQVLCKDGNTCAPTMQQCPQP